MGHIIHAAPDPNHISPSESTFFGGHLIRQPPHHGKKYTLKSIKAASAPTVRLRPRLGHRTFPLKYTRARTVAALLELVATN